MANPSSTSSSEPPDLRGFPWGLAGAAVILLLVEVALRLAPPEKVIPYRRGLEEHFAVANALAATGSADIGFIGSSMTREAVGAPIVRKQIHEALGRNLHVANYAAGGLDADEGNAVVNYMVRHDATPRMLLYEVSLMNLRPFVSFKAGRMAIFWNLRDWWREWRQEGRLAPDALPVVIRQEIGRFSLIVRYRDRLGQWIRERLGLDRRSRIPALGNYCDSWATKAGRVSLGDPRRHDRLLDRWITRHKRGYPRVDARIALRLERTIQVCREQGVEIILFEMPLSPSAQKTIPPRTYETFYSTVEGLATKHRVPFYRVSDLGVAIGNEHFADMTHMNRAGGIVMSEALTRKAILPRLAQPAPQGLSAAGD